MPTPDLPVELWFEILAYLPRGAVRKTMGVNRTLFELGFDDIYEEVRLIADDKETLKTFEQLSNRNVSRRVRNLVIRPAFLPGIDEESSEPTEHFVSRLKDYKDYTKQYFKNHFHRTKDVASQEPDVYNCTQPILNAAMSGVKNCVNLREVSIVLYDHCLTSDFQHFYQSIWRANSLGPRLQKLSIETTEAKLPSLLEPIAANGPALTGLSELSLMFGPTRFTPSNVEVQASRKALAKLLDTFKSQITSLSFSSSAEVEFTEILRLAPPFPVLQSLSLSVLFNVKNFTVPSFGTLHAFVQNSPSLKKLEIRSSPRNVAVAALFGPDIQYSIWLFNAGSTCFQKLDLPQLESLQLEIPTREWNADALYTPGKPGKGMLLSAISKVAPNLKSLVFDGDVHTLPDVRLMIDGLVSPGTPSNLQNLEFSCRNLTPEVFDWLAKQLPLLQSLTIHPTLLSINDDDSPAQTEFYNAMESRRYNTWALEKIRITKTAYSCEMKMTHPDCTTMQLLVDCFAKRVIVDSDHRCDCLAIY